MDEAQQLAALAQAIEDRRVACLLAGDFDAVAGMLGEGLIYGHSTGLVDDKASLLASYRSGKVQYRAIESRILKVSRVTDDVLVASGTIAILAVVDGAEGQFGGRYMAVWRRDGDAWRLEALQAAP